MVAQPKSKVLPEEEKAAKIPKPKTVKATTSTA